MIGAVSPQKKARKPWVSCYIWISWMCVRGEGWLHVEPNPYQSQHGGAWNDIKSQKRYTNNFKGPQTCAVNHECVIPMVPLRQFFDWKEFQRVILRSGPLGSLEFAFGSDWCWCGVSPHVLIFIYIHKWYHLCIHYVSIYLFTITCRYIDIYIFRWRQSVCV